MEDGNNCFSTMMMLHEQTLGLIVSGYIIICARDEFTRLVQEKSGTMGTRHCGSLQDCRTYQYPTVNNGNGYITVRGTVRKCVIVK
jgi:hypothetical protein